MKKNWIIAAIALSVLSCKSDDDSVKEPTVFNFTEGKQKLEDNSIEVLNKVNDFRNDTALTEIEEFLTFLEKDNSVVTVETPIKNNAIIQSVKNTLYTTTQVSKNKISATKLPSVLINNIVASSNTELQNDFNDEVGIHTWNEQKEDFDFVKKNDGKIVYSVTQNNKTALLTVSNFTAYTHTSGEEAPKSIKAELTVGGSKIMGIDYSATIANNDHLPTNVSTSLTLGALSYSATLNNNNSESSINQSLNIGGTRILGLDLSGKGNYADINTTGDSDKAINLLVNSANATFYVGSTSIVIDGTAPAEVKNNYNSVDEEVTLLNDVLNVSIKSGNSKVADGEFYKKSELKDVYGFQEVGKFVVRDRNYNQVALFDTAEELKNSEFYENYTLYNRPRTVIETNVTIDSNNNSSIWDYIQNKYPNHEHNGEFVSTELINETYNNETNSYIFTYKLFTESSEQRVLEANVVLKNNESIWSYINTKYNDGELEDGTSVDFYQNYNYQTEYKSNWYAVEKLVDSPDIKLLFEDGSKSTLEAYFEIGFEDLINNAEEIANAYSLEEKEVIIEDAN